MVSVQITSLCSYNLKASSATVKEMNVDVLLIFYLKIKPFFFFLQKQAVVASLSLLTPVLK